MQECNLFHGWVVLERPLHTKKLSAKENSTGEFPVRLGAKRTVKVSEQLNYEKIGVCQVVLNKQFKDLGCSSSNWKRKKNISNRKKGNLSCFLSGLALMLSNIWDVSSNRCCKHCSKVIYAPGNSTTSENCGYSSLLWHLNLDYLYWRIISTWNPLLSKFWPSWQTFVNRSFTTYYF